MRTRPLEDDKTIGLELLLKLHDQETTRAERASTRARQAFALAAGFFAVVQTVAFGSFAGRFIAASERAGILDRAIVAGICLTACGVLLLVADGALRGRTVTEEDIAAALDTAEAGGKAAREEFLDVYGAAVLAHRGMNRIRFFLTWLTQLAALACIGTVLWELIYSLNARIG